MQPFLFQFSRNAKLKKYRAAQETFPLYHSSCSLQIWLLIMWLWFDQTEWTHWIGRIYGIEKNLNKCNVWGAIILIIKADHSLVHLRTLKVPKIWLDLWKIHLQQLVVAHRGSPWSVSSKGSMDQAPEGWSLDWKSMFRIHVFKCRTPGGYSWELLVGVCRPGPQILTLFQTKKCYFSHPFSD